MKKYNYFYKITNNINGNYYYGVHSTNNLDDGYMGSGVLLNYAYNKYGKSNFTKEIKCYFTTLDEAYSYEAEIVNQELVDDPKCYNLICGGHGGRGYKFTDEQKQVQSKNAKKQWQSDELRKQNSDSNKKAWSNKELKNKHSEIMKKSNSDETRRKKSEAMKKRWQDPNYVKWQREINSGENNPMFGKTPHNKKQK